MENLNLDRKPLSELVKEAQEKKMHPILVIEPVMDGHERIAALVRMENVMIIRSSNVLEEDLKELQQANEKQEMPNLDELVLPFTNRLPIKKLPTINDVIINVSHDIKPLCPDSYKTKINFNQRSSSLPNGSQMKKSMLRNHRRK